MWIGGFSHSQVTLWPKAASRSMSDRVGSLDSSNPGWPGRRQNFQEGEDGLEVANGDENGCPPRPSSLQPLPGSREWGHPAPEASGVSSLTCIPQWARNKREAGWGKPIKDCSWSSQLSDLPCTHPTFHILHPTCPSRPPPRPTPPHWLLHWP